MTFGVLDVVPGHASNDVVDVRRIYAIRSPKRAHRNAAECVAGADSQHVGSSEFRASLPLAMCHAPLRDSVLGIVSWCTQEQMRRIRAWWVVAGMANVQSFLDRAVVPFPREAMRKDRFSASREVTVTSAVNWPSPSPTLAFATHDDASPVTFHNGTEDDLALSQEWVAMPAPSRVMHDAHATRLVDAVASRYRAGRVPVHRILRSVPRPRPLRAVRGLFPLAGVYTI